MLGQRLMWGGSTIGSLVLGYLAYVQVEAQLARWSFCIVFGLLFIASMALFPWGQNEDGSARRLVHVRPRGRRHATLTSAGDGPVTGNIQNTGDGDITVTHGLSVEQVGQLKKHVDDQVAGEVERYVDRRMDAFALDVAKFTGEANSQALAMGRHLITEFVEQLAERAPGNISALGTADMQHAILNAQTSAAVTNNKELADTLVDILVDKSGAESRSFKGVVLTEALTVAGKLTTDQVNLLTALLILERTVVHDVQAIDVLLERLESRCQALYGKIPASNSALQYMAYTGVGDIERSTALLAGQISVADSIVNIYDGLFTQGFTADELPEALIPFSDNFPCTDLRISGQDRYRIPLPSSQTLEALDRQGALDPLYQPHAEALKALITGKRVSREKFMDVADTDKPDLAKFIRELDEIAATTFELSSVGIAIGQANWRRLLPDDAPDVDIWLR